MVWSCLRIVSVMGEGLYRFLNSWSAGDSSLWYSICCSCWLYCTLSVLPVTYCNSRWSFVTVYCVVSVTPIGVYVRLHCAIHFEITPLSVATVFEKNECGALLKLYSLEKNTKHSEKKLSECHEWWTTNPTKIRRLNAESWHSRLCLCHYKSSQVLDCHAVVVLKNCIVISLTCDKSVTTQNLAFLNYWYRNKRL
jgi:hypothetical protein